MMWSWVAALGLGLTAGEPATSDDVVPICEEAVPASEWADGRTVEQISYGFFHFAGPRDEYCYPTQQCRGPADLTGSNCEPMEIHDLVTLFRDHPARFHDETVIPLGDVSVAVPEGAQWIVQCLPNGWHDYQSERERRFGREGECLILANADQLIALDQAVAAAAQAAGYTPIAGLRVERESIPLRAEYWKGCHRIGWTLDPTSAMYLISSRRNAEQAGLPAVVAPLDGAGAPELVELEAFDLDAEIFEQAVTPFRGYRADPDTGEPLNPASGLPINEDPWTPEQCDAWIIEEAQYLAGR